MLDLLTATGLALAATHFSIPLAYYAYIRRFYSRDPRVENTDNPNYAPLISVVVPTYNEARFIVEKLENIYQQEYPRDRIEIIIVDSGSTDGTPERVSEWGRSHPDITLRLIREPVRRGKAFALNEALKQASGEIVVITDADSKWLRGDTLKKVAVYLGSPDIGAVSCVKIPEASGPGGVEESYRDFYNVLRVAESNLHSTPVFHGELAAFKRRVLEEVGGFPTDIGADDSHTATLIALKGYRAIMPRDIVCIEAVPERGYSMWRVRRAQHLIQHFWKILKQGLRTPKQFKLTLYTEAYLHLINPWILVVASILLLASTIARGLLALLLLITGLFLLAYKPYRAWITLQLYLIIAALRNLWTKEIVWEKQMKNQH